MNKLSKNIEKIAEGNEFHQIVAARNSIDRVKKLLDDLLKAQGHFGGFLILVVLAVNLYQRLERMLATVRADGRFIDREAFLDANHDYHAFLVALADNGHLQRG